MSHDELKTILVPMILALGLAYGMYLIGGLIRAISL